LCIKRPILLALTFANLFWSDLIHSPDIRQPFSPDSIHSPDIRQPFPRTRYIRSRSTFTTFEKNVTRLDTFARVIRHFGEFGASGHCLKKTHWKARVKMDEKREKEDRKWENRKRELKGRNCARRTFSYGNVVLRNVAGKKIPVWQFPDDMCES
jgi:hypothetical protein